MIKYKQKPLFIVTLLFMMPIVYGLNPHMYENIIEEDPQITQLQDQTVSAVGIQSGEYPDTNDYLQHPVCGNKPLGSPLNPCYCGSEVLSGFSDLIDGDVFCCVSPKDECNREASNVRCPSGTKQLKSKACHGECYNSYTTSAYLWRTASLYCEEEDFCLPLPQMCSGVCKIEEDVCSSDLRCPYHGYEGKGLTEYNVNLQSLGGKVTENHDYCLVVNNDGFHDTISRLDEDEVTTKHTKLFQYTDLKTCHLEDGDEGIQCGKGCRANIAWCAGFGQVCPTAAGPVGMDNVDLCRNNTFWLDRSCDWFSIYHGLFGVGARCSGDKKHCTFPWYTMRIADPRLSTTCQDHSDSAYPINTSCSVFSSQFLDLYKKLWCGEGGIGWKCDNLDEWFAYQKTIDNRIRDPHGCEQSCSTPESDCLACHNEDYFHCQSTGICIHQSNVCDGHPHPQCGGDDEVLDDCYQTYFKRRIVRNYATFICASVMYPGKVS